METPPTSPLLAANQMIDVSQKTPTQRRAIARGRIHVGTDALQQIKSRTLPKGDALALAEVAGIMAAKRTSDVLPLCHPLPLDHVKVHCVVEETCVLVTCEACAFAKTGVEMEALNGVLAALLCIYDLTKGVDKNLVISDVMLCLKEGGRSGRWEVPLDPSFAKGELLDHFALHNSRAAVITVSDRCFAKQAEDSSGPYLADYLVSSGAQMIDACVVPDDKEQIKSALRRLACEMKADLIFTTGGTGLGKRDVTPEALNEISTRSIAGIGELLRKNGAQFTPMSWLSRSVAGVIDNTLVITLPGSLKAVKESIETLRPVLGHALHVLRGGDHPRKDS